MAKVHICCVDDCGKTAVARGWCATHYQRWKKNGDPLVGRPRAAKGDVPDWLLAHVDYAGDECLIWPFATNGNGYPAMNITGKKRNAHRVMCEIAHGHAPTDQHFACHSCGKGHEGCINPRHIRWATPSENSADMIDHGTVYRGEVCVASRLTERDVHQIRALERSTKVQDIADKYGVARRTISDVLAGRTWAWLQ